MRITSTYRAQEGDLFTPDCFDSNIGKDIAIHMPNGIIMGRLTDVKVAEDGRSADFTFEVPENVDITFKVVQCDS